jgi:nucleotide-binding universal stress UspA family protein
MARRALRTALPIAAMTTAVVGLGSAAMTFGNGEAVVERGFERAFANLDGKPVARETTPVVAGSEEFWLTHLVHDGSPATAKPVAIGDRITISSGGRDRVLHVVDIDRIDSQVMPVSSERSGPLLLVTCRDASQPQARPIRFLIEAGDEIPALSQVRAARTL